VAAASEEKQQLLKWLDKMVTGLVFFDRQKDSKYLRLAAANLHLSKCYNCDKIAVWVNERLVFPEYKTMT
jgi:uncharacterized protein DUF4145